jgi:hypothetical protein
MNILYSVGDRMGLVAPSFALSLAQIFRLPPKLNFIFGKKRTNELDQAGRKGQF